MAGERHGSGMGMRGKAVRRKGMREVRHGRREAMEKESWDGRA